MSVLLTPAAVPSSTVVKISNPLLTSQDCTFEESHHRRIAYPCGPYNSPAVHIARDARIVFCTRDAGLSAWRLPPGTPSDSAEEAPEAQGTHEHLLEMDFQVQSNLLSSAVSHDGAWLAISDIDETKLFALTLTVRCSSRCGMWSVLLFTRSLGWPASPTQNTDLYIIIASGSRRSSHRSITTCVLPRFK